jgi:hypothetical protein
MVDEQVNRIMAMDIAGSGRVELHEYARASATDLMLTRASMVRQSERGKRMSAIGVLNGSGRVALIK